MPSVKCKAIVIHTVRYAESSVVLKCFTDMHGMQSFMVNSVRSGKGAVRPSHLLPLNLLDLEITHQEHKSLQRIKELRCDPPLRFLHFDMMKAAVGTFVCEVIYRSVREEHHRDDALFSFLFNAIQILDLARDKPANYPVYFMLQLTRYLGFYPKGAFSPGENSFDMRAGSFVRFYPGDPFLADPALSEMLSHLLLSDFERALALPMTRAARQSILSLLISYYREHIPGFTDLRSHEVLSEVLG